MSAFTFRELAVGQLLREMNELAVSLAERSGDDLGQIRVQQGEYRGLGRAIVVLGEVYKRIGD